MDLASFFQSWLGGNSGNQATSYAAPANNPITPNEPIANGSAMSGLNNSLGFNVPTAQLGLSTLGAAGGLWNAFQTQRMAQDQFKFSKNLATTNLANQTKSYNTALTDRITARAATQGMSNSDRDAYIAQNRL